MEPGSNSASKGLYRKCSLAIWRVCIWTHLLGEDPPSGPKEHVFTVVTIQVANTGCWWVLVVVGSPVLSLGLFAFEAFARSNATWCWWRICEKAGSHYGSLTLLYGSFGGTSLLWNWGENLAILEPDIAFFSIRSFSKKLPIQCQHSRTVRRNYFVVIVFIHWGQT